MNKKLLICLCIFSLALSIFSFIASLDLEVEQPAPVIVNGSNGQTKNIVIGDDTVIIFVERIAVSFTNKYDSGYGFIYGVANQDSGFVSLDDVVYGERYWCLVHADAGWLLYVTGGS